MIKNNLNNKAKSPILVAVVTAVVTLLIAGGTSYFLGYLGPQRGRDVHIGSVKTTGGERKIAYWRAPMNPTEIYDKPGKSAMGMDLVPVYEDELTGANPSKGNSDRKIAYWRAPMNPAERAWD